MEQLPTILTTSGWSSAKKRAKYDQDTGLHDLLKKVESAYKAVDWNFCGNSKNVIAIKESPDALRKKINSINAAKIALEKVLGAVLDDSRRISLKIKEDIAIKDVLAEVWKKANAFRIAVHNDKCTELLEVQLNAFQRQASDLAPCRVKARNSLVAVIKGNMDGLEAGKAGPFLNPVRDYYLAIVALHKLTPGAYPAAFVNLLAFWGSSKSPLYSLSGLAPDKLPAAKTKLKKDAYDCLHAINENDPIT